MSQDSTDWLGALIGVLARVTDRLLAAQQRLESLRLAALDKARANQDKVN